MSEKRKDPPSEPPSDLPEEMPGGEDKKPPVLQSPSSPSALEKLVSDPDLGAEIIQLIRDEDK